MKAVASSMMLFLLATMFVSLFHMSSTMDMSGGMSHCPFMAHEEVLCPMNLADHIGAWKSVFLSVLPTVLLLLAVVGSLSVVVAVAPHLVASNQEPVPILYRQLREQTYTFARRPLQELFSKGILNPKVF